MRAFPWRSYERYRRHIRRAAAPTRSWQHYLSKNGEQVWGHIRVRIQRTGRWLIIDEGTG